MPRQERTKSGTGIYHVMLGMKNNGTFGAIDNLTISYNGNQLVKVTDAAEALNYSDALDFHDGDDTACEYDYDNNGALTRDSNRGIKSIAYDYAHYPSYINMSIGKKIRYVDNDYTADGRKLSSKHKAYPSGNISVTTTDLYIDGLMLRNDAPLLWRFDGGYVDLNANGTPTRWNYYIADHLGSTRMVVDSNDSIRENINYYPFGSEMRMENPALLNGDTSHPFRFTGKELDRQNSLNMYDFGARLFDVAGVPMWTSVDPLAEKYYNVSPYVYCENNPVIYIDPDGRKKHNWIKGIGRNNNASTQKRYENRFGKSFVQIWAHGYKESERSKAAGIEVEIDYYAPRIRGGGYYHSRKRDSKIVRDASELNKLLKKYDRDWSISNSEQSILILHSCATSEFAQEISGSQEFQNVIIIAPTENVHTSSNGDERIATTVNEETGDEIEGQWEVFKNGKPLLDKDGNPITYPSNSQVGTIGFEYGF